MGSKIIRILKLSRGQVKETKGGGGCLKGYYIHLSLVNKISCDVLQQQQNKIGKKKLETLIVMIFFVCVCLLSFFFHDVIQQNNNLHFLKRERIFFPGLFWVGVHYLNFFFVCEIFQQRTAKNTKQYISEFLYFFGCEIKEGIYVSSNQNQLNIVTYLIGVFYSEFFKIFFQFKVYCIDNISLIYVILYACIYIQRTHMYTNVYACIYQPNKINL
eukprot:TRINITY_DN3008_c1_g1_i3.p2 TRINITY_DN3008_c1_g1~~TRINITY_DN3008_c1_g1_i3.p2  ORF type:complete len:215 (+),score=8.79 TRINITY_DN3008_c1_g1_i3:149-793(+)